MPFFINNSSPWITLTTFWYAALVAIPQQISIIFFNFHYCFVFSIFVNLDLGFFFNQLVSRARNLEGFLLFFYIDLLLLRFLTVPRHLLKSNLPRIRAGIEPTIIPTLSTKKTVTKTFEENTNRALIFLVKKKLFSKKRKKIALL